jgi:hypothetical protein
VVAIQVFRTQRLGESRFKASMGKKLVRPHLNQQVCVVKGAVTLVVNRQRWMGGSWFEASLGKSKTLSEK